MKPKFFRSVPVVVAAAVIAVFCLIRWAQPDWAERVERMTFDMRTRQALLFPSPVATNLGFVFIDEESVRQVWNGSLDFQFGLYWPRQVYGRLVRELSVQGAKAVAFDILMGELRPDHPPVLQPDEITTVESDQFFADEMRRASNVIIAVTREIVPPALFQTNALGCGDITTEKDSDGVLRRVQILSPNWHAAFRQGITEFGFDLVRARIEPRQVVVPLLRSASGKNEVCVPLDENGEFDLSEFVGDNIPRGMKRKNKPFTEYAWHMGIVLAAQELELDLKHAEVDLPRGRVTLRGPGGIVRAIPVDRYGYAYVDWCLPPNHPSLTQESIHSLLLQDLQRDRGQMDEVTNRWRGKLVVVGSSAVIGNNLTDRGATPLDRDSLLVSKHWNVANSVILDRFVCRSPLWVDLLVTMLLGVVAATATWRMRALRALILVLAMALAYVAFAFGLYVRTRYWLPVFLPVVGAELTTHLVLLAWRVVFEQAEQRRIKAVFSTMVSPKIATEVLESQQLSLEGARREITVLFADVRGFTQFTDQSQEQVTEWVRRKGLTGAEAEACFEKQARDTLRTINLYLSTVANTVIRHDGILDKFIGDCVMAFWGAPTPNPRHAAACVRAAMEAQFAVYELNLRRTAENQRIEEENRSRIAAGQDPKPLLPILHLGTGINTGLVMAGLMGAEVQTVVAQANYTVFGREVNLASRLEGASGRGRIFIGKTTHDHLLREDPALAATCIAVPDQKLKGFSTAITVYEVPWLPADAASPGTEMIRKPE